MTIHFNVDQLRYRSQDYDRKSIAIAKLEKAQVSDDMGFVQIGVTIASI